MSFEICTKCKMPVGEWNEQRRRERFQAAVAAMQGILCSGPQARFIRPDDLSSSAISHADALLRELSK